MSQSPDVLQPSRMELRLQLAIADSKDLIEANTGIRPEVIMTDSPGMEEVRWRARRRPQYHRALESREASDIAKLMMSEFETVVATYDEAKYPPKEYRFLLNRFGEPEQVTDTDIRRALVWKYGHMGKPRIPGHHEALAREIWTKWPLFLRDLPYTWEDVFRCLGGIAGSKSRFITMSFLIHLMFPTTIPIIDQHNFRAMNHFMMRVRWGWKGPSKPSNLLDIQFLADFMSAVIAAWPQKANRPGHRSMDVYLMMKGSQLKRQR